MRPLKRLGRAAETSKYMHSMVMCLSALYNSHITNLNHKKRAQYLQTQRHCKSIRLRVLETVCESEKQLTKMQHLKACGLLMWKILIAKRFNFASSVYLIKSTEII